MMKVGIKIKLLKIILALIFICFVVLGIYTNVPTHLTSDDKVVFESLGIKNKSLSINDFESKIVLIKKLQDEIFKRAPFGVNIPYYHAREPADLMRAGQGQCFDRSRSFDKGSTFIGIEARHVYLLYKQEKHFLHALITRRQQSHAVTEIKTSKGWMLVDSNMPWVALTRNGEPVSADYVWKRFDEFDNPPPYLKEPWWAIRGMYSRKGHFYEPYILFPEFNWPDFINWLVFD
jgi:hypothetical protein